MALTAALVAVEAPSVLVAVSESAAVVSPSFRVRPASWFAASVMLPPLGVSAPFALLSVASDGIPLSV